VPETAVADTGPILHLSEIGETGLLSIFTRVSVSQHVRAELARHGILDSALDAIGDRLQIERVSSEEMSSQLKSALRFRIHRADLSTLALASRIKPDLVLTDDLDLRKALESQGYQVVGSIGVLLRALRDRRFKKTDLLMRLDQLLDGSTLYTSKAFRMAVREMVEKLPE